MKIKVCSKCDIAKPLSKFYKQKKGKCGVQCFCIICQKEYYIENRKKIAIKQKA